MSKKKTLIPELRFPEFSKEEEWEEKTLGELTKVISKRNKENKNLPVYSINNKEGFLPQAEQFEGISSNKRGYDISQYKIIERNTFAYNPARINVGSLGYSGNLHNILISSLYVCFKTTDRIDDLFLLHFFDTSHFIKEVENNVEGGIRSYLFYQNFSKISISLPAIKEQKKIADCLTSLDELINAHSDKLAALKNHKKGLMQNLFPQEGKKVPKVRFQEFKNDGDWELKELVKVAEIITGNTPSTKESTYYGGEKMFVSPADMSDNRIVSETKTTLTELGFSKTRQIKSNSVLFVCIGSTIGKVAQNKYECATNQQINSLVALKGYSSDFLYSLLDCNSRQIASIAGNHAVPIINKTSFSAVKLPFPPSSEEQKKIASCLLALDELITAQATKIEKLQQHKKGLMQDLFPKTES